MIHENEQRERDSEEVAGMASRVKSDGSSDARAREASEAAAEWVDIGALTPWDKNPRKNDEAAKEVARSIKRFGFGSPILARRADGEVIAGHTRLKAAQMLGLTRVPVRYLDLDPAEAHLLALADNKLGEKADWDDALLGAVLSGYGLDDAAVAGFDQAELDKLAADFIAGSEDDQPSLGELSPIPVACPNCGHEFNARDHGKE